MPQSTSRMFSVYSDGTLSSGVYPPQTVTHFERNKNTHSSGQFEMPHLHFQMFFDPPGITGKQNMKVKFF